jgi:hypothetical protein
MLKIHQRMGLITAVPLLATVISSASAGGKNTRSSSRDLRAALAARPQAFTCAAELDSA